MSSCALQKSSESTSAAEYKKTDAPQPDVKEEAEEEEEEAKEEEEEAKEVESGMIDKQRLLNLSYSQMRPVTAVAFGGRVSFYFFSSSSAYTLLSFGDLGLDLMNVELFSIILCSSLRSKEE